MFQKNIYICSAYTVPDHDQLVTKKTTLFRMKKKKKKARQSNHAYPIAQI